MSRNIKEIGKELMGKSLNSFHRKTGLTQLEENNKMQDGILDGILSQVDDAYIEKTEQSNVIHLDGSGDGVVVLDSIEGNTEKLEINNLITNGLVCWLDGRDGEVENYWKDKSGNGNDFILQDNRQHNNDSMYFNGGYAYCKNSLPTVRSMIITFNQHKTQATWQYLMDSRIISSKTSYVASDGTTNNLTQFSGFSKIYINGIHSTLNIPTNQLTHLYLEYSEDCNDFNMNLATNNMRRECLPCDIYGVQLYNRPLTESEILHNMNFELNKPYELQSSFEEKVNDEGKYEIEILSKNRTLSHEDYINHVNSFNIGNIKIKKSGNNLMFTSMGGYYESNFDEKRTLKLLPNTKYGLKVIANVDTPSDYIINGGLNKTKVSNNFYEFTTDDSGFVAIYPYSTGTNNLVNTPFDIIIEPRDKFPADKLKQNKIKLLLDEPLRAIDNIKDRLCIRDNKLMVERNINQIILDNNKTYGSYNSERPVTNGIISYYYQLPKEIKPKEGINKVICDILPYNEQSVHNRDEVGIASYMHDSLNQNHIRFCLTKNALGITEELQSKPYTTELLQFLRTNPISVVYRLNEPYYEEVLNEYGEPIILEGYENGTIYIDSTIVPTTTVRYTPKMESFKTLKEVNNNNIMLTNDVNDNIIPYMMDVDLMIMEKEMALMSQYKIRRIGVKDMTSMQKRTQDMLERLIKGRTLTEQECKTRVTTYLNAGKITDAQAEELMLLISEVYA